MPLITYTKEDERQIRRIVEPLAAMKAKMETSRKRMYIVEGKNNVINEHRTLRSLEQQIEKEIQKVDNQDARQELRAWALPSAD